MVGSFLRLSVMILVALGTLLCSVAPTLASDATIYVIHEPDGTLRFTNKPPPAGVKAQIFRARSSAVAYTAPSVSRGGRVAPSQYDEVIAEAAREHQVDPALIKAVIHAESAFNPHAVSPKGAMGLMQLMPETAREVGVQNAFAPASNIFGGTSYLAGLIKQFGRIEHALAAYNAGGEHVRRYKGIPPFAETQEYVRRVLNLKKRYTLARHG
jgi:soluble lytic murein transglycosylase-like protein